MFSKEVIFIMLNQLLECRTNMSGIFSKAGKALCLAFLIFGFVPRAQSQASAGPQPVPEPPAIKAPADIPFPGTISLMVDARDVAHRVLAAQETIPVQPGELTLLYPAWIPGDHSPTGPISRFTALEITANGKRIPWVRDQVDVFAFHIHVPSGVSSLDVKYDYLAPIKSSQGRISFSSNILNLEWNTVALYPAGYFARDIRYSPAIHLPGGWHFASALEVASDEDNVARFKETPLNTLVDSPLYAGVNFKRINLSSGPDNKVYLDAFADEPKDLDITPKEIQIHRNLVVQEQKLFHSHHYAHYDFLLTVSDVIGGIGLEHHQSSEDGAKAHYFTDWGKYPFDLDLLSHESTHSWNGKFRRPDDLWTPNFNVPKRDDLLWVYEGLTQYYGQVLSARAGFAPPEEVRDTIARYVTIESEAGRTWRPLVDTTNQPTISQRRPVPWQSWQRDEDYYLEGLLIWLDADTRIREMSNGKKSLDDFAREFYGIDNGSYVTRTYDFDDIVAALNKVEPYDWKDFLRKRIYRLAPQTPEEGITRGGYRLAFTDTEPKWMKGTKNYRGIENFDTSLGFTVDGKGELGSVIRGSPAFKAGMTSDMSIAAVNNKSFSTEVLRDAILAVEKNTAAIELLVKQNKRYHTVKIDYHGGLRYPVLERVEGTPDYLDAILAPK